MSAAGKPKPLKVFGRNHYACVRCKAAKVKCSGEQPCSNCRSLNKDNCIYPSRDRKIVIMESDLNKLHDRVKHLEGLASADPAVSKAHLGADTGRLQHRIAYLEGILESNVAIKANVNGENGEPVIQERQNEENKEFLFNTTGLENFLLSDDANEIVKWRIIHTSNHQLPPKEITINLIKNLHESYGQEFYIVDLKRLSSLVDDVYSLFESINCNDTRRIDFLNRKIKRQTLCYFFSVLAYAEQVANIFTKKDYIPGIRFHLMAAELFNLTYEQVSFEFIQAATILALYSSNLNRYNTVYNYFGVAIRSAISQGFHRQPLSIDPNDAEALVRQEKCKRLWWTIFITDATWTSKMNMPSQISYTETDVDLPTENPIDLHDSFDTHFLELNVHLAKHISKSVKKIYGPKQRSFSVNYINTDKFNQKSLIKNVLSCFKDLIKDFEVPFLYQYKNCNILENSGRKLANLFLRFNLLVAIMTKPLISLIFKTNESSLFDDPADVEDTINKAITTSVANVNILLKLYELNRVFVIGFYDSQYLYTSILIIIMTSITDRNTLDIVNRAIALLRLMAKNGNINAQNGMKKLTQVNDYLSRTPELDFNLNLELDIDDIVHPKKEVDIVDHYYNPYEDLSSSSFSNFKLFKYSEAFDENLSASVAAIKSLDGHSMLGEPQLKHGESLDYQAHLLQNHFHQPLAQGEYQQATTNMHPGAQMPFHISHEPMNMEPSHHGPIHLQNVPIDNPEGITMGYQSTPMELEGKPPHDKVFTNNRIQNLSDSSQNTLMSMMNNLQHWGEIKNLPY